MNEFVRRFRRVVCLSLLAGVLAAVAGCGEPSVPAARNTAPLPPGRIPKGK